MFNNTFTSILFVFVLVAFVGIIGYAMFDSGESIQPVPSTMTKDRPKEERAEKKSESSIPEGWKEYRNTGYRLAFFHPAALVVREQSEGNGAITITFEDIPGGKEFQIFIVPYAESEITRERIKLDIPSGVVKDEVSIVIDDARGKAFHSQDPVLGETREVWFVREGALYEVTTHRALAPWLDQILSTWRFLP